MSSPVRVKRIHDPVEPGDGERILVDGLWPRGVRKTDARIDRWMKELAPSAGLRRWFGHDPARWDAFRRAYWAELDAKPEAVNGLLASLRNGPVTLVFAARDRAHNNAAALKTYLDAHLKSTAPGAEDG